MSERTASRNGWWGGRAALACLSLGVGLGALPSSWAKRPPAGASARPPAQAQAARLVQQGVMALATRDFTAAYRALAAAYRLQPSAETLYQLGVTALASGDSVGAQDLMRRYLAEAGAAGDAARRSEAQRIAERPRAASGEVTVLGTPGAFVLVDERLVGRLPLPRPLLVPLGVHVLAVERDGAVLPGRIELRAGQGLEARPTADGKALQVRPLPTIFVRSAPALSPALQAVLDSALTQSGLSAFDATAHSGELPPPECATDRPCLVRWAAAQGVQYALELDATAAPCALRAIVVDVAIAEEASRGSAACADAGGSERTLSELVPPLLREAMARPQGTLHVTTEPAGAQVRLGERVVGKTPLSRPSFAVPLELSVQLPGYQTETRQVVVAELATTEVQIVLRPVVAAPAPAVRPAMRLERHRPRWRIAVGITALAVGAGLVGLGASALHIDGGCVSEPVAPVLACERRYDTGAAGLGLVVPGALLLAAGIPLLAVPGSPRPVAVPAPAGPRAAAGQVGEPGLSGSF